MTIAWNDFMSAAKEDCRMFSFTTCAKKTAIACKVEQDWRSWVASAKPTKAVAMKNAKTLATWVVNMQGPPSILLMLLSEWEVPADFTMHGNATLLFRAIAKNDPGSIDILLDGHGDNKASPTTTRQLSTQEAFKNPLLMAMRMTPSVHYDDATHAVVDRTGYVVRKLLHAGANFIASDPEEEDLIGQQIVQELAACGNVEVAEMLIENAGVDISRIDFNMTYNRISYATRFDVAHQASWQTVEQDATPLLCVRKHATTMPDGTHAAACEHIYTDGPCVAKNCNMGLVKLLVANGANPLSEGILHREQFPGGTGIHLELCYHATTELVLAMYKRAYAARVFCCCVLQRAIDKKNSTGGVKKETGVATRRSVSFPPEVLQLIIKFAGIGETVVSDPNTPWVPSMAPRCTGTHHPVSDPWANEYVLVDALLGKRELA